MLAVGKMYSSDHSFLLFKNKRRKVYETEKEVSEEKELYGKLGQLYR
jgi:hypothetical protein